MLSVLVVQSSESLQTSSPSFLQQTPSSPFRCSQSPSSSQNFNTRLASSHHDYPPSSYTVHSPTSSSDSRLQDSSQHQHSGSLDGSYGSHLKASLLSCLPGVPSPTSRAHSHTKIDSGGLTSRVGQQPVSCSLKSDSPGQTALHTSSRLLSASTASHLSEHTSTHSSSNPSTHTSTHYPQRHFQHSPLQGAGVRTQSGSF